ncbi:MAG: hypothetical protein P1U58_09315 [Verrucomicrobiales bacterium]|nr:hypothetical protein [Verrucomicrobiales bacterium]
MRIWLLIILAFILNTESVQAWTTVSGESIEGKPAVFLYDDKTVWFARSQTQGDGEFVSAKNLSLRDRQRLLISPVLYKSFPEEPAWPREKRNLLLLWIFSPVVALYLGFWIAGIIVTRKLNPVRALFGFLGGWILGIIMFSIYLYFSARLGGGAGLVLFGSGVALVLLSFYISAVYHCDIFKGLLIFILQLFITVSLTSTTLIASESLFDKHEVERFWNEKVFAPVGLIENPNPFQTLKSDSSEA